MPIELRVLHVPDCPNLATMLTRLREVTDLPVATREIATEAEAVSEGMAGSPTLLINGVDPFRTTGRMDGALACRLYPDEHGHPAPAPDTARLRHAITDAVASAPGGDAWRARARPRDPAERAVHQAVLRAFATTGHAPPAETLLPLTAASGRTPTDVLTALHELDALRLDDQGRIAVAYPFSARPTRHRVRIADGVEVHAMCAIDALGISPMLGADTTIRSTDPTTGEPVTVGSRWDPETAVVFLGATAGGPSADCCCGYLNFFAGPATARAWMRANPQVPGRLLDQHQAHELARKLFGTLLRETTRRGPT